MAAVDEGAAQEKSVQGKSVQEEPAEIEKDVLPESLNNFMACAWVVLFGGRWLLIPMIQMTGLLSPGRVAAWDDGLLLKTYLILLSITCVVLALRAVRRAQSPRPLG